MQEFLQRSSPELNLPKNQMFFTPTSAAKFANSTSERLYRLLKTGVLKAHKLGVYDEFISRNELLALCELEAVYGKNLPEAKKRFLLEKIKNSQGDFMKFDDKEFYCIEELCEMFGVSRSTIDRRVKEGSLQAYKMGGSKKYFFKRSEILAALVPVGN